MSTFPLPARTPAAVHPWAPRFAQAITGMLCLEAVIFQTQAVVVIAAVFIALALIGPRWSPVAYLFALLPVRPAELEPSRPVRFAQLIAISMLVVAIVLLYSIAWKQLVRRGGSAHALKKAVDLEGSGPWLLVVTAPNCPRCGPAKRAIEDAAGAHDIVSVDLSEHPEAGALPIWSVPAGVIVEPSGNVGLVKTGAIGTTEARQLVSALG